MSSHFRAILWAQWRSLLSSRTAESRIRRALGGLGGAVWYGLWTMVATGAFFAAESLPQRRLGAAVTWGFLGVFTYWQFAPILSAHLGGFINVRKLLLYPISRRDLFRIELLLRAAAGAEMLLVLLGGMAGLMRNPAVPIWGPPLAASLFIALNLFAAAGTRSLLERLLAYKRIREALVFLFVLIGAAPQFFTYYGLPPWVSRLFSLRASLPWPWAAAGNIATGAVLLPSLAVLAGWVALAYVFGKRQFYRGLIFDFAARAAADRAVGSVRWSEALYRIPRLIFTDPLAALLEKELRSLCRTPRFRLVFLMGFSFGVIMWWPMAHRAAERGESAGSYTVPIALYAVVLLAEAVVWNVFGFDRAAAQLYFSMPVPVSKALAAKNLAAAIFIFLEITLVTLVCAALRLPMPSAKVLESYAVTLVLCLYLTAVGNLASVYLARPANPESSWGRMNSGKMSLVLLASYPVLAIPILLAYGARYAFDSQAAFFGVLALVAGGGVAVYYVALDSALRAAERRKELMLATLSESAGPLVAG